MGRLVQIRDADMNVGYTGRWCLKYVQDAYHTAHPHPTATAAWEAEPYKHYDRPPIGLTVPIYLSLGNEPAGHVAIRLDDGLVASSTQAGYHPKPYFHPSLDNLIAVYAQANGGATYLGWGEFVGNTKVVGWEDIRDEEQRIAVPFDTINEDDSTLPEGETKVKQEGKYGERHLIYRFTFIDNVETNKAVMLDETTSPVPQINLIGTYVKPPEPIPEPELPPNPVPPIPNENSLIRKLWRIIKRLANAIVKILEGINDR